MAKSKTLKIKLPKLKIPKLKKIQINPDKAVDMAKILAIVCAILFVIAMGMQLGYVRIS